MKSKRKAKTTNRRAELDTYMHILRILQPFGDEAKARIIKGVTILLGEDTIDNQSYWAARMIKHNETQRRLKKCAKKMKSHYDNPENDLMT